MEFVLLIGIQLTAKLQRVSNDIDIKKRNNANEKQNENQYTDYLLILNLN